MTGPGGVGADLSLTEFEQAVADVLMASRTGDVFSYGELAEEAGYPGAARAVGGVLSRVDGLPWWRVVTADGRLVPHNPELHAEKLAAEGVRVDKGRVSSS